MTSALTVLSAAVCGYTQHDVETLFSPLLKGVDMEKFQSWYNGYNFNGENVYNPFDVLLCYFKGACLQKLLVFHRAHRNF